MPNNRHFDRNAKVVNGEQIKTLDLFVDGVFISKIAPQIDDVADVEINAMGKLLLPGLIDDQVHFREPGLTHKEQYKQKAVLQLLEALPPFLKCQIQTPKRPAGANFKIKLKLPKHLLGPILDLCLEAPMTTSTKYSP